MRQFVESLRRLYKDKKVTKEKITEMCNKNMISKEEMLYILD